MKKGLTIVLVVLAVVIAGAAYVGYRAIGFVKEIVASCKAGCVWEQNGNGPLVRGSGHVVTENRQVAPFNAIRLESSAAVTITRGDAQNVAVTSDDNLLEFLLAEVKDGTLHLAYQPNRSFRGTSAHYRITVVDLRDITLRGSGNVRADGLAGAGVSAAISGSGNMQLSGRVDQLTLAVSGSGNLDAGALQAKSANVSVTGSGNATVNATDTLDAKVSGSGDIRYLGTPKLTQHVSGSGSIKPK